MFTYMKSNLWSPISYERMKLRLKKISFLTGTWIFAGLYFSINQILSGKYDYAGNMDAGSNPRMAIFFTILISTAAAGLITGIFEAFIFEKRQYKLPFGKMITYSAVFYLFLYFLMFIVGVHTYRMYVIPQRIDTIEIFQDIQNYLLSFQFLLSFITFGMFVYISIFMLHAREKFGFGALTKFFTGRYFNPKEEERIFMFLDIKSATSIAEKLGALKYHQFLNDFFMEITYPILYKEGEIYQYVGDEITISWPLKTGLKNYNCVECFYEIQKTLYASSQHFVGKYGVFPEFKAGLHSGKTVTGEIGIIKREIVYSGDTLNTASRIQELCNHFNTRLLLSKELMEKLGSSDKYNITRIGEIKLRGKKAATELYGIKE